MNEVLRDEPNIREEDKPTGSQSPSWIGLLSVCGIAILLATIVISTVSPVFPRESLPPLEPDSQRELIDQHRAATIRFRAKNYAAEFGVIGLLLGMGLGFTTSSAHRIRSVFVGGVSGFGSGAVAGFFIGTLASREMLNSDETGLVYATFLHFGVWASMVGMITLATFGSNASWKMALHRMANAVVACGFVALGYVVAASYIFVGSNLMLLIPVTIMQRIVWALVCATVLGLSLVAVWKDKPARPVASNG